MAMQTDIREWYGARTVDHQAVTAPGPQPQRGPPPATGGTKKQRVGETNIELTHEQIASHPLILAQWNAEGLKNKKPELQEFLRKEKVDIICIQETHLSEPHRFFVRGYELFRHDRKNQHKGGLVTLVRNTIPAAEINRSEDNVGTEYLAIKIVLEKIEVTIYNIYCSPDKSLNMDTLPTENHSTFVLRDMNSHSPSWGYEDLNARGEHIEDWMTDKSMLLLNKPSDQATFWSRTWKKSSTSDLAFATEELEKKTTRKVMDQLGGSDHRPVLLMVHEEGCVRSFCKDPSWNNKKANWNKFEKLTTSFCQKKNVINSDDLDTNVKHFTEAILEAAKWSIPRGRRQDYKPYWSDTMELMQTELNAARNTMEETGTKEAITAHNRAKVKYEETKTEETRKAWFEKTESLNMEKEEGKVWKLTQALNDDYQEKHRTTILKENEKHITGKQAANLLAETFKENSTLEIPREKIADIRQKIKQEARHQDTRDCMTTEFTMYELNKAILKLKSKKAPGPDGITNEMIKHLSNKAKENLLFIFNQSWKAGTFPNVWKEATIIPILKKSKDKTDKKSYRPISLLSCLGKTMERMINSRLQNHLEKNKLLNPNQSGFRRNRSTEDQVTYLVQEIENAFQQKMKALAIFIDLTAAFDKVWKEGLLFKLLQKKICGNMYNWIQNYLFQRTARVKLDGQLSNRVKLREGVPQGGVISPTLFIIFIDDITDHLTTHISKALHADDLAIWTTAEETTTATVRMQTAMNTISNWAEEWIVTINRTKTQSTLFSLSTKKESFSLKIENDEIPQQETPTYLGVKLDKKLTWTPYLSSLENKAIKKMAIMRKLSGTKWGANTKVLKQVYTGAVRPHLEYGSTSFGTAAKTNTGKLKKVQNTGLRIITGAMKTTPISAMEETANLQSLEDRRQEKSLRQGEKIKRMPCHPLHKKLAEPTKNRLKRQSPNHLLKLNQREHINEIPLNAPVEPLQDYQELNFDELNIILQVPGIENKGLYNETDLQLRTMEMLHSTYPQETWTHVFTDGSAESAVKNGGAGVFIRYPDGTVETKSEATGKNSTNFRAEACAMFYATKALNDKENLTQNTVILTDCKSLLQSLTSDENAKLFTDLKSELNNLQKRTNLILQWIPSHCGVSGNEKADKLSKEASKCVQQENQVTYHEIKTIIRNKISKKNRDQTSMREDHIGKLNRQEQVMIFRLRTGHCQLLSHMYKLKLAHTNECPCNTGIQTVQHVLQDCPIYTELRCEIWRREVDYSEKLWGPASELLKTTAGLKI